MLSVPLGNMGHRAGFVGLLFSRHLDETHVISRWHGPVFIIPAVPGHLVFPGVQVFSVFMTVKVELAHQTEPGRKDLHIHFSRLKGGTPMELDLSIRFGLGRNREYENPRS